MSFTCKDFLYPVWIYQANKDMGFFTSSNDKIFRVEEKNIWSEITIHSSRFANDLFIDALGRQFKVLRNKRIKDRL